MLDLGTGSGFQALVASNHADEVVAADIGERAVALARGSALLNDASSIDVRNGSWFAR